MNFTYVFLKYYIENKESILEIPYGKHKFSNEEKERYEEALIKLRCKYVVNYTITHDEITNTVIIDLFY